MMKCDLRLAEPPPRQTGSQQASRRLVGWVFALVLLGACSSPGNPSDVPPGSTVPAETAPVPAVDLTNERIQTELGSPPFEPVNWQRSVGPFLAIGDDQLPDPEQIALMTAAAGEIPPQLTTEPRALVRTSRFTAPSNESGAHAVAVALGPDIYLLDPVFDLDGGTSRLNLAYALTHELVHVAQWYDLDPQYVAAARAGDIPEVVLADGSASVADFAEATGWRDTDSDPTSAVWELGDDATASSEYGATSPVEDMADTVAWAALGRTDWLDAAHLAWLEAWLGVPAETLAAGKPWSPAGSREVLSAAPVYDDSAVADLLDEGFTDAEPLYFELPDTIGDPAEFAEEIGHRLAERGMVGSLGEVADDRLPRFAGAMERADGTMFWVELWDFRESDLPSGPDLPILTYVLVW